MDRCVCCGYPVPEGRQVCPQCEVKDGPDLITKDGIPVYLKSASRTRLTRCPFCKKLHVTPRHLNVICSCGAKFYIHNGQWWDRKTGEVVQLSAW